MLGYCFSQYEWFSKTYYGNTVGQWAIALAIVLLSFIVGKIAYWICGTIIKKLASKTKTKFDDIVVDMAEEPLVFALTLCGVWYDIKFLTFNEYTAVWIGKLF